MIYSITHAAVVLAVISSFLAMENTSAFTTFSQYNFRKAQSLCISKKYSPLRVEMGNSVVAHSRFEKMKQKWKGLTPTMPTEDEVGVTYADFDKGLDEVHKSFQFGDTVKGIIDEFLHKGALVDIGGKAPAWCPENEYSLVRLEDPASELGTEKEFEFKIISGEDKDGQFQVSIRRLQIDRAWEVIKEMEEEDGIFEVEICGVNRGGAVVLINGLRGFLPGSHFVGGYPSEDLIGQKFPAKFLNVDRESNKILVSHRFAVMEERMKMFREGAIVEGTIQGVKPYGVFVNVEGIATLLHISEISNAKVNNIEELFQEGQVVKAVVLENDQANNRIALTCKVLEKTNGDILRDMNAVFENAETNLAIYNNKKAEEAKQRDEAAQEIIQDLGKEITPLQSQNTDAQEQQHDGSSMEAEPELIA
mmetsp:Transcript_9388/g.12346  ORF Transcript_9388/g.12346 Transcript_9388/m.12346 type:complete len:420 (-) Transcript_9388:304-1563(-)|eukprot:CAMPEP_0117753230 /NCGR_PEP_ID=MMETSP0947-20121206/12097_1 /TAXON_ID=44440 /ORGANISM="Chattonella subsalsa, Strain CCMP2191" /LENGTH=419 /DNA_ID=CAMNT_0005572063 /DNA_START=141 /DNA_END=1400 /DNA_ORIENTATION=-